MEQLGLLLDAPPAPAPVRAPAAAKPQPKADQAKPAKGRGRSAAQPVAPAVIDNPLIPPLGAVAKIDGHWHQWRKGSIGGIVGWEIVRPEHHAAHASEQPPRLDSSSRIAEPFPADATVHMEGHALRISWSEYGFAIYQGETHLLHFSAVAACAVAAAEIARANEQFRRVLTNLGTDADRERRERRTELAKAIKLKTPEPDPEPEPPAPAAPAAQEAEESPHYRDGFAARNEGMPRDRLPGWMLEVERDPKWRRRRVWGRAEWLRGWDAACGPCPIIAGGQLLPDDHVEPDALEGLERYSQQCPDSEARGRFSAHLRGCLDRKRSFHDCDSAKEKKAKKARKLDRTDIRRAFRSVCPRPFNAVAADAWKIVDEYDRLCREQAQWETTGERRHALRLALDELMVEANGGTSFGVKVYHGPKRLMKALRVRARAERRAPMWGVKCKFRFEWRGLSMISETGDGFYLQLDTRKHAPGTLCHSSTGYRSMCPLDEPSDALGAPQDYARRALDKFVDGPTKDGMGLGGQLQAYRPWWLDHYREAMRRQRDCDADYRREHPAMTKPDARAAYWAKVDADDAEKIAKAQQKAAEWGLDLAELCPDFAPPRQGALL